MRTRTSAAPLPRRLDGFWKRVAGRGLFRHRDAVLEIEDEGVGAPRVGLANKSRVIGRDIEQRAPDEDLVLNHMHPSSISFVTSDAE